MEWTAVTVIIALVGLVAAVAKPLLTLNSTMTRLDQSVRALEGNIAGVAARNSESHDRLWEKNELLEGRVNDHESRLRVMESMER